MQGCQTIFYFEGVLKKSCFSNNFAGPQIRFTGRRKLLSASWGDNCCWRIFLSILHAGRPNKYVIKLLDFYLSSLLYGEIEGISNFYFSSSRNYFNKYLFFSIADSTFYIEIKINCEFKDYRNLKK